VFISLSHNTIVSATDATVHRDTDAEHEFGKRRQIDGGRLQGA
jgi:hypothetical protein